MFEMEPLTEIKVNEREGEGLTEGRREREGERERVGDGGTERESGRGREGRKGGMESEFIISIFSS